MSKQLSINMPNYLDVIKKGDYKEALELILKIKTDRLYWCETCMDLKKPEERIAFNHKWPWCPTCDATEFKSCDSREIAKKALF